MSVRRVLVGCAVLSLQDACVFYPCCKACFSRLDAEHRDALRYRCSRCGYWCLKDQVDYRYRLSLRVVRDTSIFGVTVFGNSLNPFFGIHASGLQRLVENLEGPLGPSARSTLLVKAVEDCFLGRHFIFGIKVSRTEREPWLEDPDGNESSRRERAQFVASQMILPTASGLTGCTVLSYYQRLLQKASQHVAESSDPSKTFRPLASPLLLISGPSPNSTFSDVTLFPFGLLSQSTLRSQHQDHSFAPTSVWQQSLGLVTSSAEQEEICSQDGGNQSYSLATHNTTPHPVERVYPENHPGREERTVPLQLEGSFLSSPSSTGYGNSSFGNSFRVKTCFSPSQPRCKSFSLTPKELSTPQQTQTFLSSSFAWDDLPFSEGLTAFLCEQNKDFNVLDKSTNLNLQHQKQTARTFVEIAHLSAEPASACQSTAEKISIDKLQDITNTVAPDGQGEHILSDQDCKNCAEHVNRSEAGEIQLDDKAYFFPEKQEEHNEAEGYNCSADLFGDSLMMGVHTETHTTHAQTVSSPSDACFQCPEMNDQHLKNENSSVSHSTPHKQKLKGKLGIKRDSLDLQDFDFVPPSQSTPITKVGGRTLLPTVTSCRNLKDESSKENLTWSMKSRWCRNRITPGRRFRKPKKNKDRNPVGQHALKRGTLTTSQKHDSTASDVSVCDYEDREGIVAPTPAFKMQLSVAFRKRLKTENSCRDSGCNRKGSGGDGGDKTQTVFHANDTVDERHLDASEDHCLSEACNWSRDLFSDSI
ncbi:hypothetical protein CRENBAI_000023 [Crenichthys baileyi]|uniref:Replication factor A C-terminal domain-containing protein n=1 Tax=Crenichthys baileyi TaxID=28760 RepID=A0AAV9STM6_9TELE